MGIKKTETQKKDSKYGMRYLGQRSYKIVYINDG